MFFMGMVLWGLAIGWIGQLLLGKGRGKNVNWLQAMIAGVVGSFVGGLAGSFLMGEGFQLRIGGVAASVVGAIIVLLVWNAIAARRA